MRQRLHVPSWSGRSIDCRRFRLTSFSGVVVGSGDEVYALTPFDRDFRRGSRVRRRPSRRACTEALAAEPRRGGSSADGRADCLASTVCARAARPRRAVKRRLGGGWAHAGPACATRRRSSRGERSSRSGLRHSWRRRSPLASAWSRSQRRCRARSTSSSNPTTSNCWSWSRTLVDAGELRAEVDSVFPLTECTGGVRASRGPGSVAMCSRLALTSRRVRPSALPDVSNSECPPTPQGAQLLARGSFTNAGPGQAYGSRTRLRRPQQVITQGCVGSPVKDPPTSTPSYADERRTLETSRMCLSS